jgi:glycosyltransferase involved in cell wall biosynthesis
MGDETCRECLPDGEYRRSTIELTRRRLEALQGAEAVIVLSAFMARELAGAGVDGAAVVPPWVDCGPIRTEAGGHFLLGGRLVAHKGVADGWRAWNEARRPLPLVVAGSGPLEHELVGTHRRGWLSPTELRAELRRARALIFASGWQEPLGILGIEALAEGTPVIVAESGGTGEWSAAGCLRVPAGDVPAMADAIRRLAADPDLALDLGKAGQESVRELFARERIWPVLEEVYTRVAAV